MIATLPNLESFSAARLLVIGDLILDEYLWGEVARISPEAPVPIITGRDREFRTGGAGSVVDNLATLNAQVEVCGLVGRDKGGEEIAALFESRGVSPRGLVVTDERPTTRKTRLMAYVQHAHRAQQQILRVDWEQTHDLSAEERARIDERIDTLLAESPDVVLVSDYEKGLLSVSFLRGVIERAQARGVPVLVDPGRSVDYERYRGATLICPNRFEAEQASGMPLREVSDCERVGQALRSRLDLDAVVLTIDRDGIFLVDDKGARHFPTRVRAVTDVTGAGDMVLSMLGLAVAAGWSLATASRIANVAAGIEVSKVGVVPVELWELQQALMEAERDRASKLRSRTDLTKILKRLRAAGKKVVLTNGCFDFVHGGHVLLLEKAASLGDVLVVALNSDASVTRLKGEGRPIYPADQRASILSAFAFVDHIVVFDEETPLELIREFPPDVLVKGDDYRGREVVGRELVEASGGRVELVPLQADTSTTAILKKIRRQPSR